MSDAAAVHLECQLTASCKGTSISFRPGTISGGDVVHDCGTARPVGYFLEWLALLAPFAKKELRLTLKGITTGEGDLGVSHVCCWLCCCRH